MKIISMVQKEHFFGYKSTERPPLAKIIMYIQLFKKPWNILQKHNLFIIENLSSKS